MATRRSTPQEPELALANPWLAAVLAWVVPGGGHVFVGQARRGLFFFALIVGTLVFGCSIGGQLPWQFSGSPLFVLASLGGLGSGLPFLVARFGFEYAGELTGAGFEYGRAFIITAGLMNWMLVLDAWDIASGKGSSPEAGDAVESGSQSDQEPEA